MFPYNFYSGGGLADLTGDYNFNVYVNDGFTTTIMKYKLTVTDFPALTMAAISDKAI